jgi:hypothetical protein
MNLNKIEDAIRPAAKRATTTEVKKRKKKRKKEKKSTKGKSTMGKSNSDPTDDLGDILNIKKQRAVSNELDDLIYEQEQIKRKRLNQGDEEKTEKRKEGRGTPSIMEALLANDPEKIKDLSMEDAMKFSMLQGGNGGSSADPLMAMMMSGLNAPKDNGGDMMGEIMKGLINKVFSNDEKKSGGDNDIMKLMMAQNMQTQQMLMKALIANNNKGNGSSERDTVMKEMLELIRDREKQKESLLMDKLREVEMRASSGDPLNDLKRMMDYMNSFGILNQNQNPEVLEHQRKMKELEFQQQREMREEELKDKRVNQVSNMIDKAVGTFADVLSKPTAQAVKSKLDQMSQSAQQGGQMPQIPDIPEDERHDEIDLGDLNLENEMNEQPEPQTGGRMPRFSVRESGEEME